MTDLAAITPHLRRRFAERRVVFWHDSAGQYSDGLDAMDLPGISLVRVANNEFALKHQLLLQQPSDKILVYRSGEMPTGIDNWLADLEFAYGVFTADHGSLVAQDLGLAASGIDDVVREHAAFFGKDKFVQSLKALLKPDDDEVLLRAKMTAVVLGQSEHSLLEITRTLLVENAKGVRTKYDALGKQGLIDFYWAGVSRIYGYASDEPSIDDFVLWLFDVAIAGFVSDRPGGLQNARLDLAGLRHDPRSQGALAMLAMRASKDLDYKSRIKDADFRDLRSDDYFPETDQRIITGLVAAIAEQSISARDVGDIVRTRQTSAWIDRYRLHYRAIETGAELLHQLSTLDTSLTSFDQALDRYRSEWFRIDQLYRQFCHAYRSCEESSVLDSLRAQVESRYTSKFLYELGASFQKQLDGVNEWRSAALRSQQSFYESRIARITRSGKKAVVIVSDALRYEAAEELGSRIRHEDRFDAELDAMLGVLPTYTQLGMAALLPHDGLKHSEAAKIVL
ncbi:MAG: BREX-1 system phosphatase PglZ type A, partial [Thermoleophilia bacterium]|nr:BREX-1 system phosphatase PglZ type A [Thermoleophilia bacterium]